MPKSKHRKDHKKKVAARNKRLEEQRNAIRKRFKEQFIKEVQLEADKIRENNKEEGEVQ